MYATVLLVVLYSGQARNDNALPTSISKLCGVISVTETVCPYVQINDNLICFQQNGSLSNQSGSKHVRMAVCQNWSGIRFTTFQGRRCIKNMLMPKLNPNFTRDSICAQHLKLTPNITLHEACEQGRVGVVRCLALQGVDLNSKGESGQTPVMVAVKNRKFGVFDLLVRKGCDLSVVDDLNNTILHVACKGGNTIVINRLLDTWKYNIESKGELGRTPVMYAAYIGRKEVFHLLKRKGCNLTVVDNDKNNILHVACMGGDLLMVENIVSLKVIDLNSKGKVGRTPVMMAALWGHRDVFNFLKNSGCNLKALDSENNTVLHMACIGGHVHMVKHIVSLRIFDIDVRGLIGRTPLMAAAAKGKTEVVSFLVSDGCDINLEDDQNCNVLHMACVGGDVHTVKNILALNSIDLNSRGHKGRTPIMMATIENRRDAFDLLASAGCSLTAVDTEGNNLLHLACYFGPVEMADYILSLNITGVGLECRGHHGLTPLMMAAVSGQIAMFDLLVRKGSNLATVDTDNNNILHLACLGGNIELVKFVVKLKVVNVNWKNKDGRTPGQAARRHGHTAVIGLCRGRL